MEEIASGHLALDRGPSPDQVPVHSYYLPAERVLIDPIAPEEGLDWFAEHGPPTDVAPDQPAPLPLERRVRRALRRDRPLRRVQGCTSSPDGERSSRSISATSCPGGVVGARGRRDLPGRDRASRSAGRRARARRRRRALGAGWPARLRPGPTSWTSPSGRRRASASRTAAWRSSTSGISCSRMATLRRRRSRDARRLRALTLGGRNCPRRSSIR